MQTKYIFQIGMICAGSTSLCKALNILGIPSLHYKIPGEDINREVFELDVIPENIKLNRRLFYPYDEEWSGFLDFNGLKHYKTLYKMYPESKFIYTWREYDSWMESSLRLSQNQWRNGFDIMIRRDAETGWIVNHNHDMINQDLPEKEFSLVKADKQGYWEDNQKIPKFFKNNPRFLQMKICDGDGWEKLCNFLEMPIPDVDFPHVKSNDYVFDNPVDK